MLASVNSEAVQEQDQTREALVSLSKQLELANRAAARFRTSLANRDEALAELSRASNGVESAAKPYAGIFVADVLSALRLRHGNEISEYLLDEVSRKKILPLIPGGKIFRWSAQSVLAVWHSRKELAEISAGIVNSCQMPFDCRAFVGTRTATFRIALRSVVLSVQWNNTELVRALDSFAKEADTR
jgi:hypothetical protein